MPNFAPNQKLPDDAVPQQTDDETPFDEFAMLRAQAAARPTASAPAPIMATPADVAAAKAAGVTIAPNLLPPAPAAPPPVEVIPPPPAPDMGQGGAGPVATTPPAPVVPRAPGAGDSANGIVKAGDAAAAAATKEGTAQATQDKTVADAEAQGATQAAQAKRDEAAAIAKQQSDNEQARKQGLQTADAAEQKYADFKFHNYWDDKSTANKLVARLSVFLGGAGGGENRVLQNIQTTVAQDFERQKEQRLGLKAVAEWKRQGVRDLDAHAAQVMADLHTKFAASYEAVAQEAVALTARAKSQTVVDKGASIAAKLQAESQVQAAAARNAHISASAAAMNAQTERMKAPAEINKLNAEAGAATAKAATAGRETALFDASGNPVANLPDKERAKEVGEKLAAARSASKAARQLADSIARNGITTDPNILAYQQSLRQQIISNSPAIHGFKRLSGEDIKLFGGEASPDDWTRFLGDHTGAIKRLRTFAGNVRQEAGDVLSSNGVNPGVLPRVMGDKDPSTVALAYKALQPGSGATPEQQANARKYLAQ